MSIIICTPPNAPGVTTPVTYCQNATASQLAATGQNLLWYTVPTNGTGYTFSKDGTTFEGSEKPYTFAELSANVQYKIRVKDSNGCTSPAIN